MPDGTFAPSAPAPAASPDYSSVTEPSMGTSSVYGDPAMLAFIRASGMSNEIAAADVARRQAAINQALGIATQDTEAAGEQSRRNIAGGMEARGVFRSGQNMLAQQYQEEAQARRLGALRLAAANQIGDLHSGLLSQIAANQQKAASLALTTGMNQDTAEQTAGIVADPSAYDTTDTSGS